MDSTNLILTKPVLPPTPMKKLQHSELRNISDEKRKHLAKEFESVLLSRVLDQMKNTIGDWGFEKDAASSQVQGIFWMFLAQDIGNNGGIGLWKDIYQFLTDADKATAAGKSLDGQI